MSKSSTTLSSRYSVVSSSQVQGVGNRLDAEYYQLKYMDLEKKLLARPGSTLRELGGRLDCSAFYPSIVEYYNFDGEGMPFLRVNDLSQGFVHTTASTAFLPEHVVDMNSSTIAVGGPGDIVIAKGGNTLAKVGIITDEYPRVALSRDLILLRTSDLSKNKYFVWMFLHSHYGQDQLWRTASQTGQPHLTLPPVSNIRIPHFTEEFEGAFERLYRESRSLRDESITAYGEAESLLLEYLGDIDDSPAANRISIRTMGSTFDVTGRLDAEYNQTKYEQVVDHIRSKPHDVLGQMVDIRKSIEPGRAFYSEDEEGIPFVRVGDFDKFGLTEPAVRLSSTFVAENAETLADLMPMRHTVLLSKDGSVGQAFCLQDDSSFVVSGGILLLTVKESVECLPDYLAVVLNSPLVQLQAQRDAGGSNILHWKPSQIEDLVIPTIDVDVQKEISRRMQHSLRLRSRCDQAVITGVEGIVRALEDGVLSVLDNESDEN